MGKIGVVEGDRLDLDRAMRLALSAVSAVAISMGWVAILAVGCPSDYRPSFSRGSPAIHSPAIKESDPPASTPWQLETQAKLDEAGKTAAAGNRSVAVIIPPGRYELVTLKIPANVALVFGTGLAIREGDLVYVGSGGDVVLSMEGGYGTTVAGCQIRSKRGDEQSVTGIRVSNVVNGLIANVRVDLRGARSTGLVISGRESMVVSRAELRAATPFRYEWGDNCSFRDLDLGCTGNEVEGGSPAACVLIRGMPHQLTFDGSQTWQGGDHAVWGEVASPISGQNLNIANMRYEQSLSAADPNKAAIHLRFTDRKLENLLIVGSRWTDRKRAFNTYGITQTTVSGSRLVGTQ